MLCLCVWTTSVRGDIWGMLDTMNINHSIALWFTDRPRLSPADTSAGRQQQVERPGSQSGLGGGWHQHTLIFSINTELSRGILWTLPELLSFPVALIMIMMEEPKTKYLSKWPSINCCNIPYLKPKCSPQVKSVEREPVLMSLSGTNHRAARYY